MKRSKWMVAVVTAGFMTVTGLNAQQTNLGGETVAGRWLLVPGSARVVGMAGVSAALAADINAYSFNPAGLALLNGKQLLLSHHVLVQNSGMQQLSFGMPLGPGAIAFNASYFSFGKIERYALNSGLTLEAAGDFSPYGLNVGAGWAQRIGKSLELGLTANLVQQKLDTRSDNAYTVSAGGLWQNSSGFKIGSAVTNMGSGPGGDAPTQGNFGIAYVHNQNSATPLSLGVDSKVAFSGDNAAEFAGAVEYQLLPALALRAGGHGGSDQLAWGPAAGFSFRFGRLELDYGFDAGTKGFAATHHVTLVANFDGPGNGKYGNISPLSESAQPSEADLKLKRDAALYRQIEILTENGMNVTEEADGSLKVVLSGLALRLENGAALFDSATQATITGLARALKKAEGVTMVVNGYTDSTGTDEGNLYVSNKRAQAVKEALAAYGFKADSIKATGLGAVNPLYSNDTSEGRAKNRRVEVLIDFEGK